MSFASGFFCRLGALLAVGPLIGLTGCAHFRGGSACRGGEVAVSGGRVSGCNAQAQALKDGLTALAPTVREDEAARLACCAFDYSEQLAREYRVVRPALFHNFLVNIGLKKRGLCYQWAEDLLARLQMLKPISLEFHWGMARVGTVREHNCVVVTARGQPFQRGIVLDAWRRSGRLVWKAVADDKYPWVEGELTPSP